MGKMLRNNKLKQNSPFIVVGILVFLTSLPVSVVRDDQVFLSMSSGYNMLEFWQYRYETWSSRNIIETILVLMANCKMLWIMVNTCLVLLMCYSFMVILDVKEIKEKWMVVFMVAMYPMISMSGAGWIATTTNYLWVAALGIYACTSIVKTVRGEEIKWYTFLAYIGATLYAGNQEQGSALLTIIFGTGLLFLIYSKKKIKCIVAQLVVAIASVIYHLTAVGNGVRTIQETQINLPEFANWTLVDKVKAGFLTTMYHFVLSPNRIIFILVVVLCIGLCFNCKGYKKYVVMIPLISIFVNGIICGYIIGDSLEPISSTIKLSCYLQMLFILVCVPIAIYFIIEDKLTVLLCIGLLGIGLLSRMILGFSPTLNASGVRTFLFMYITILLVIGIVYKEIALQIPRKWLIFLQGCVVTVAMYSFSEYIYGVLTIV